MKGQRWKWVYVAHDGELLGEGDERGLVGIVEDEDACGLASGVEGGINEVVNL